MDVRKVGLQMVLVLGAAQVWAQSPPASSPPAEITNPAAAASADETTGDDFDADAASADYKRNETALFDALRADPSPRRQALAARIHVGDGDDTPTALRPKRDDVLARAVALAPDDALVQWIGATNGSYMPSRCGPTTWPEAEVANLLRIEPDNAAAWQFAVALASAANDQDGIDAALSRMATSQRADDHFGDELDAWTSVYAAHPEATSPMARAPAGAESTAPSNALLSALQRVSFRYSPAASALDAVCKPDASTERTWQRLGWCADAARLLANSGSSLDLREQGLKLLATIGDHGDATAALQRQYDWLAANGANPMQNYAAMSDPPQSLLADWHGARSEIDATEQRLKRTGQPLTPPAGWMKAPEPATEETADAKAMQKSMQDYVTSLLDDMRGSSDVRERALALASGTFVTMFGGTSETAPKVDAATDPLSDLAAANPDNLIVQWVTATASTLSPSDAVTPAIANVQRLEGDNAAAWAMSLSHAAGDATPTLQRMATSPRYDEHTAEILGLWLAAVQRHPAPAELADNLRAMSRVQNLSADAAGKSIAMMGASVNSGGASSFAVGAACNQSGSDALQRKDSCIAIGRLLLHSGRTLVATTGAEQLLRKLGALDARDQARARQLAWWQTSLRKNLESNSSGGALDSYFSAYFADYLATGSEVEALRLAAARIGSLEPPTDWQSPAEKQAAKRK